MLLMEEAARIAQHEHCSKKIAVISGVGTRHYYRKLGCVQCFFVAFLMEHEGWQVFNAMFRYSLDGPYMSKLLAGSLDEDVW